jgi:hypothetical protein
VEFNYQFDEYCERFFAGRDYCLLGNGYLQCLVQLKGNFNAEGNAALLNLICADEYRSRPFWLLSHHAYKETPSCTAVKVGRRLYVCDNRQVGTPDLDYALCFEEHIPELRLRYRLRHELKARLAFTLAASDMEQVALAAGGAAMAAEQGEEQGRRAEAPVERIEVEERLWCPVGLPLLFREMKVRNAGGTRLEGVELWAFLAPNRLFLPDARIVDRGHMALSGYWGGAPQFLGLGCVEQGARTLVAEYPGAVELALEPGRGVPAEAERLRNPPMGVHLAVGLPCPPLAPGGTAGARFFYAYGRSGGEARRVATRARREAPPQRAGSELREAGAAPGHRGAGLRERTRRYWQELTRIETGSEPLDSFYRAAQAGIRAAVSAYGRPGRINSGIWHYDSEWSRDNDFVALAAALNGQLELSRQVLGYALSELTDERGSCACGASWEGRELDYQVDTNGLRLYALWSYLVMSGDESVLREHWPKVRAMAELLLEPRRYREHNGATVPLILGKRDCWERWEACGLQPGYELHYQFWASAGLVRAARLAAAIGAQKEARRWGRQGEAIWRAALEHPLYALVHEGRLCKRRGLDGSVQLTARGYRGFPTGYLEPDASELFPLLFGGLDPRGPVAVSTVRAMEALWNQDGLWRGGGHTRYHLSSDPEPTSGPWPGITTLVARACLRTRQLDTFRSCMQWLLDTAQPTYTTFEHHDYVARGKGDHRFYRAGIIPWLAFAEPSFLFVRDLLGFEPEDEGFSLRPNLPPELPELRASLRYRGVPVTVSVTARGDPAQAVVRGVTANGREHGRFDERGAQFPVPREPLRITLQLAG